jgi:hypothetical protein
MRSFRTRFKYSEPPPTLKVLYDGQEVGELEELPERGYRFRYLPAFAELRLAALPGIRAAGSDWKDFEKLPRFFEERIPDLDRPEIKEALKETGVDEKNCLEVLGKLSRHAVTDPFELKLINAA